MQAKRLVKLQVRNGGIAMLQDHMVRRLHHCCLELRRILDNHGWLKLHEVVLWMVQNLLLVSYVQGSSQVIGHDWHVRRDRLGSVVLNRDVGDLRGTSLNLNTLELLLQPLVRMRILDCLRLFYNHLGYLLKLSHLRHLLDDHCRLLIEVGCGLDVALNVGKDVANRLRGVEWRGVWMRVRVLLLRIVLLHGRIN